MPRIPLLFIAVLSLLSPLPTLADEVDRQSLAAEASVIVKKFGALLQPRLKEALQTGGPVNAINVCSVQAPRIAAQLSAETQWSVKRVSLKPRNQQTARPDDWEEKMLQQFDEDQRAGQAVEKMVQAGIVDGQFRFIKAQAANALCLQCHGKPIDSTVEKALQQHYPEDMATGYSIGQIRGAFSLSKEL